MEYILINTTQKKKVIDITKYVNDFLQKKNWRKGLCFMFIKHTTAALTTADLDPGTDLDMIDAFEELIPKLNYRHQHDPSHVADHILSSLIGTSTVIPVEDGRLALGIWQRVILVELGGPKERQIILSFVSQHL